MPHIHTQPNQHDMTVSGWIIRKIEGEWKCLVHFHRKIDKYMQIGGHIELDETPWQAIAHELAEESGYQLDDVTVLQPSNHLPQIDSGVAHPVPIMMNTHNVGNGHFHSDLGYAFVATNEPSATAAEGESSDFWWLSLDGLRDGVANGEILADVVPLYEYVVNAADHYVQVPATTFSLGKPTKAAMTYKRGAPGEN